MKFFVAIIAFISLYDSIACAIVKDCGSVSGKVTSATVSGCSSSDPRCIFKEGTNEGIEIQFTSNVDTSSANIKLSGVIAGATIPFQTIDGCTKGLTCPVKSGSSQTLKLDMSVPSLYKGALEVKVEVQDSNGKDIVCQQIPATIQ